jgi:hypothetical protein
MNISDVLLRYIQENYVEYCRLKCLILSEILKLECYCAFRISVYFKTIFIFSWSPVCTNAMNRHAHMTVTVQFYNFPLRIQPTLVLKLRCFPPGNLHICCSVAHIYTGDKTYLNCCAHEGHRNYNICWREHPGNYPFDTWSSVCLCEEFSHLYEAFANEFDLGVGTDVCCDTFLRASSQY